MDIRSSDNSLVSTSMSRMDEHGSGAARDRATLGFVRAVEDAFGFLAADFGFKVVERDLTYVRYESEKVCLVVYHGRRSYEIGVEVSRLHDGDARRYRLPEVLGAVLGETAQQNAYYLQSSTREGVRRCVEVAATFVKQHFGPLLKGKQSAWNQVCSFAARRNEEYTREVVQQPVRDAAEQAWRSKNYAAVAQLYGSIRDDLTRVESMRLEYARKQLSK
jgi:hypothetical protein